MFLFRLFFHEYHLQCTLSQLYDYITGTFLHLWPLLRSSVFLGIKLNENILQKYHMKKSQDSIHMISIPIHDGLEPIVIERLALLYLFALYTVALIGRCR